MIVRILNGKEGRDKFYDCRHSCMLETALSKDKKEVSITFEFVSGSSMEVVLNSGDEVYYMNDSGKTVHVDRRMYSRTSKQKVKKK